MFMGQPYCEGIVGGWTGVTPNLCGMCRDFRAPGSQMLMTALEISGNTWKRRKKRVLGKSWVHLCVIKCQGWTGLVAHRLGCKELKVPWVSSGRSLRGPWEEPCPHSTKEGLFASHFGIMGLYVGFHLKRFCYKEHLKTNFDSWVSLSRIL